MSVGVVSTTGLSPKMERLTRTRAPRVPAPPWARGMAMLLAMISAGMLLFAVDLLLISPEQHKTVQAQLYGQLRLQLAEGSAPVSPVTSDGKVLPLGSPVAVFDFSTIGIHREVAVEGTGSGQTMEGIGHRRDTAMPCQVGTSVLMARDGAFGAVGGAWKWLAPGDQFTVTMGQGQCTYEVLAQRSTGDAAPVAPTGREGRIVLTTAAGAPFMPTDVQRVDAELVTPAFDRPTAQIPVGSLPSSELAMGSDDGQLFGLVLLLEALAAVIITGMWLWRRWNHWQTWIAVGPLVLALGLLCAHSATYLLPNLL